nr:putative ribonuclease H-like domain-containing protein [Tanacetum cinerariifolium]GEV20951.1 putative ribonuclease H-like domain-containing protein [Tanacetum cinerariifolium]
MLRLCHRLIACSIARRSQAPEKICEEVDDTWAWVASGPERQQVAATGALEVAERLGRLEEDVHGLRGALGDQREVLDSMARDFSRFTTWTVTRILRMMDQAGVRIAVIIKYLVKISKKARILELKRRNMKKMTLAFYTRIHQGRYGVYVPVLHKKPQMTLAFYTRIQYKVIKYSGRYRTWSLLQETPGDDENATNPPPVPPTPQAPHIISTIKLPILKKGEYDILAMKMEHYLTHTDYPIWEVIQKGNGHVQVLTYTNGHIRVLPPKTAKEILARERERKERTTLLMAIPEDHLTKFHKITDAKEIWEAIKSRFGGNDEYKKMQKYILKQQFKGFSVSNSEGLHKGYDRFQSLLSQLKIHGACISTEDANQKFLSSLPSSCGPQLDNEDLKQVDEFDLEEIDLKWRDTGNTGYKARDNRRRPAKQGEHKAMLTIDGEGVDWTSHAEDDTENYALMAFNSSNLGSDTESKTNESDVKTNNTDSCESNSSVETFESVPKLVEYKPKAVSEPKVWSDAPIIEEYKSDSDDEYVFKAPVEQEKPSCAFINTIKHVKTPRQTVKDQDTCSQNPKVPKRDWTGLMSKRLGLGYGYTRRACYVCDSFSHLIRDCDFHEKIMAKQVELNKSRFPINAARQNFSNQAASTSTVRKVNTARPIVNEIRPRNNVYKSHSPIRRPFNRTTAPKENFTNHKVNTIGDKTVSAVRGNQETAVKTSAGKLDFKDVYFVKELQDFNLCSVSQMCDEKNKHVTAENKASITTGPKEANNSVGTQDNINVGNSKLEAEHVQEYCVLPLWSSYTSSVKSSEANNGDEKLIGDIVETLRKTFAQGTKDLLIQAGATKASNTNYVNNASTPVNTASTPVNTASPLRNIPSLEDIYKIPNDGIFTNASYDDEGAVADFTNLESTVNIEPKKISQALKDKSWVDAMQEELLQFKTQQVWILVDLSFGKKVIGTKWVYRNKKDERGVVVRIKAGLVAQGHRQEEGIDYDEEVHVSQPSGFIDPKFPKKVYKVIKAQYGLHQAPRAWYATLSTLLVKSGYRRGIIDKTLFIKKDKNDIMLVQVYVDDIIFGSTKKSWCDEFEALMKSRFHMSSIAELTFFLGLLVKQREDGIFISQDKYVAEILKKFDFMSVKTTSTPIETKKPLVKDAKAADVDVHIYRSMIGSLMYLTASRPDIMYAVCACSRFQVTPKTSHLHAMKRIFRYLKGQPKLGLWYHRESSFDLEAYLDSDYAGANIDRKSITGGCQFLGRRLISWQCKKQTIVATSTTEAEYVAAASYCGQVLWIQNQMLDYGFNFMNTKFYIDNESTIWSYADKVKVINAEAERISAAGETLNAATLIVSTVKQTATGKETSNPFMVGRMLKMPKYQMSSSSSESRLENNKVFEYILQVIKTPKLKKHKVMLLEVTTGEEERKRQYC